MTVLDGDRRVRVPGAVVRLWGRSGSADRAGVARIHVPHLRLLRVTVSAPGFSPRTVLVHFDRKREATLRIYRPDLQWPVYGVTASRAQAQSHIRLRPPFRTVWSVAVGGLIEFPAVVDDGVAYIANARGSIRALSMRFGTQVWRHDTPGRPRMASSPAVAGRLLVYHTMDGRVIALDRANGHVRWSWSAGSPIESSPIVRGGVDYFGAWNGRLYALDLATRELRWTREARREDHLERLARRRLALHRRLRRTALGAPGARRRRPLDGLGERADLRDARRRRRTRLRPLLDRPVADRVLDRRQPALAASAPAATSTPRPRSGAAASSSAPTTATFYAVSAASGAVLWRVGAGGPISGAAVVVDGVAYAGSFAHRIVGVDAATGKTLLTFGHGHYVPVSGNGMRLLFHGYSRLYAVEPRARPSNDRAVTRITASHTRDPRRPHT